ncbi:MAG: helix-turn-helix transcriptional regulator [Cyanobacteria bacterium P01_H01_bin.21]
MTKDSSDKHSPTRIAELRKRAHLTQIELADRVGVTETTIANWENGRADDWIERIALLCDALECSIQDLLEKPIKDLRIKADLTQRELAKAVNVRENTVATWEKKDTLRERIENVARLCIALQCSSPEDLIPLTPKKTAGASKLPTLSGNRLAAMIDASVGQSGSEWEPDLNPETQ